MCCDGFKQNLTAALNWKDDMMYLKYDILLIFILHWFSCNKPIFNFTAWKIECDLIIPLSNNSNNFEVQDKFYKKIHRSKQDG